MRAGPIRFAPEAMTKVWGGRRLAERLGRKIPDGPVGECWEISARPEARTHAITGPRPGATPDELLGAPFPLLVKTLDAADRLSVQVHPGLDAAAIIPGAESKHELWVVLDVTPDAVLWRGFKNGADRDVVAKASRDGSIADLLVEIHPRPGDIIEIPPGTVHAIGPGCLLLEVQESSDTTFRAFDWNRPGLDGEPRELHVDEALACFRFADVGPALLRPLSSESGREVLTDAPALTVERIDAGPGDRIALTDDRVRIVSNVGDGVVRLEGDELPLLYGDSALLLPNETEFGVAEGEPTRLLLTSAEMG